MSATTPVFALGPADLNGLCAGQQIFITTYPSCKAAGPFEDRSALFVGHDQTNLVAVCIADDGAGKQIRLPIAELGSSWTAYVPDGFVIKTPMGLLHASPFIDPEYPGIEISLLSPNEQMTRRLALVEYTPGGEGLCGWDPTNPALTRQEIAEVPKERIMKEDGTPIESKDEVKWSNVGEYRVTAGLVTRAWPNELWDMDDHRRVFHTEGDYKE